MCGPNRVIDFDFTLTAQDAVSFSGEKIGFSAFSFGLRELNPPEKECREYNKILPKYESLGMKSEPMSGTLCHW